jgi:hypothetical protein
VFSLERHQENKMTTAKRQGHTRPVKGDVPGEAPGGTESTPRLPHERDESSDSQHNGEPRPLMRKAHDDIAAGRVDTDRGPPMDAAYQRQKETRPPRKRG